jgi:hypothetical protein
VGGATDDAAASQPLEEGEAIGSSWAFSFEEALRDAIRQLEPPRPARPTTTTYEAVTIGVAVSDGGGVARREQLFVKLRRG